MLVYSIVPRPAAYVRIMHTPRVIEIAGGGDDPPQGGLKALSLRVRVRVRVSVAALSGRIINSISFRSMRCLSASGSIAAG
jgi:hypothetical protein